LCQEGKERCRRGKGIIGQEGGRKKKRWRPVARCLKKRTRRKEAKKKKKGRGIKGLSYAGEGKRKSLFDPRRGRASISSDGS